MADTASEHDFLCPRVTADTPCFAASRGLAAAWCPTESPLALVADVLSGPFAKLQLLDGAVWRGDYEVPAPPECAAPGHRFPRRRSLDPSGSSLHGLQQRDARVRPKDGEFACKQAERHTRLPRHLRQRPWCCCHAPNRCRTKQAECEVVAKRFLVGSTLGQALDRDGPAVEGEGMA